MVTAASSKSLRDKNSPTSADCAENREPSNPILTKPADSRKEDKTWGALKIEAANDISPSVDKTSWNVSLTYNSEKITTSCTAKKVHKELYRLEANLQ